MHAKAVGGILGYATANFLIATFIQIPSVSLFWKKKKKKKHMEKGMSCLLCFLV